MSQPSREILVCGGAGVEVVGHDRPLGNSSSYMGTSMASCY